ncbi:hypothetical protein [Alienimonas californiensis]|uniref:Uncharacterized protein n=1 Tax=Alienimonas californiensis TaxID=2527989 RepID=A0A517P738_9PLAN|nr:hypothetical protein [Alienimonas californiensis]QDT15197.1 hypothetical protein CA12_12780 [Alienimonas californiensis]
MPAPPLIAWVDALGAVLLRPGDRLTLGGPPRRSGDGGEERADLALAAPLAPVQAAVVRAGEGWALEENGALTALKAGGAFTLGRDGAVRGTVTTPNPLSAAAAVRIDSSHRPAPGRGPVRLEHAVIAAGPVIVGGGTDCHVRVRGATGQLLFRAGPNGWQVRGAEPPSVAEPGETAAPAGGAAALEWRPAAAGDVLTGGGVSLRLEALPAG